MASSSVSRKYDVFPSFNGGDVRTSFFSHLYKELDSKSINTFKDHGIERSHPIRPALLSAIRESMISIVIFSENYASSTWCLDELAEIHTCYKELNLKVIPVFYKVDPSHVRKQTENFGKIFEETCKGKPEDHKQRWMHALTDVANMAGEDLQNWKDEAKLIETITNTISSMLFKPSGFGHFVGVEAHLERLTSMMCLESEEVRMVGIVGTSGIGKSTIGQFLVPKLSSQFHHHASVTYDGSNLHDLSVQLHWQEKFLRIILGQNNIKIERLGEVEKRLKHKKVLIVLDNVDHVRFLETLVGKTEWFGPGSRIIVITQDRHIFKAHEIEHIYEVELPSEDLALEILCRSAFGKDSPPDGFMELAVEVVKLAGKLPLGLSVLGSSYLKGRGKDEWIMILPELQNGLDGDIEKTLRVCYEKLDEKHQKLFLYIACFFKGKKVSNIKDLLGDIGHGGIGHGGIGLGLTRLAEKSLIRITLDESNDRAELETVEMHDLLQKLGIEIDRALNKPGRGFLTIAKDTLDALTDITKKEKLIVISMDSMDSQDILEKCLMLIIDQNLFEGMPNLQFIDVSHSFWWDLEKNFHPRLLKWDKKKFPDNLRLLKWDNYPARCLPSHFKTQFLVELTMRGTNLKKLWKGTQELGCLKKMDLRGSVYLEKLPDLSYAINLEKLLLFWCPSLVTIPFSFQNIIKLRWFDMGLCKKLETFPTHLNWESIEYLNIVGCDKMKNFPEFEMHITTSWPHDNTRYFYFHQNPPSSMPSSSFSRRYDAFASLTRDFISKSVHTFKDDEIEITSSMPSSSFSRRYGAFASLTRDFIHKSVHTFTDDEIAITSSMPSSSFSRKYDAFASFIGEIIHKLLRSHQLDRKSVHTFKDDEIEITSSSSSSRRYDVFLSFSSEDVYKHLSHIVKELDRKSINTFKDNGIERSLPIGPALLSAIRESMISIVIFSENYASSTGCLNELVEIHKCFKEMDQIVIPVFYKVDPSHVQEQTGKFGNVFEETCKGEPEDHKKRWMHALTDIANMAGKDHLLRIIMFSLSP